MDIHVVKSGDTLYSIALQHGVPMSQLILDNQLPEPDRLVVGQAIVIQYPEQTYTVQAGDTLFSIAAAHQTTVRQLLRDNPALGGGAPYLSTDTPIPISTVDCSSARSPSSPI